MNKFFMTYRYCENVWQPSLHVTTEYVPSVLVAYIKDTVVTKLMAYHSLLYTAGIPTEYHTFEKLN